MSTDERQQAEQQIAREAVSGITESGFRVSVNDGEATVLSKSDDVEAILDAMFSTDQDILTVYSPADVPGAPWTRLGFVQFIYGNDGWDVIADNSLSLEPCLKKANALSASLERQFG